MPGKHYCYIVMPAGETIDVKGQSTSDETAEHVTGSSNDEVTGDDEDDEVVASRDHASVSMATADASSSSSSSLAVTVELPPPPLRDVIVTAHLHDVIVSPIACRMSWLPIDNIKAY